ncbi:probable E3 ubiquitin-protein ligase ARI5 [Salvia miltiorrhiza]|uniref:probable E3 ubiquitin-protein ligase ARI5 n=1 Tax=Salvia miltiorrhiza TaxID=226208 RepID=UPI0025ABE5C8|nr:probable E3 ubiquitin-protein ligase ARI5 [Salvia miltiorrhiza]
MDSEEDAYYNSSDDMSEGAAEYSGGGYDDDDVDIAEEEPNCTITKKPYTILNEEKLTHLQESDISEVSNLLAVTRGVACMLLIRKKWRVESVLEEWFADEDKVRKSVGISTNKKKRRNPRAKKHYCKICMETVALGRTVSAPCGHPFCSGCWAGYVSAAVSDGATCLALRCPEPKCAAVAGLDIVEAMANEDAGARKLYRRCLLRSYVESSRTRKWCPGPGCDLATEFDVFGGGGGEETSYDVTCDCGFKFCWRCGEDHRPVACATVARWAEKNVSDENNAGWIIANTKTCPGCLKPIEKNQGCNHMTCKCGQEFCWTCMQKWKSHSHVCNQYFREKETAIEASLHEVRSELDRYTFYYERWASNDKSKEIARADAAKARREHLPELAKAQGVPETALEFVPEAWEQIVECRSVLKWSYVYGYYVEAEKKGIFECLQGKAEESLEGLHHCAEKEAAGFMGPDAGSWREFDKFKMKLLNLTRVTKKFFENLVRALENGLAEVEVA